MPTRSEVVSFTFQSLSFASDKVRVTSYKLCAKVGVTNVIVFSHDKLPKMVSNRKQLGSVVGKSHRLHCTIPNNNQSNSRRFSRDSGTRQTRKVSTNE